MIPVPPPAVAVAPPATGQVTVSRTAGSGRLVSATGAAYPLGALTYLGSSGGRGVLQLDLASGGELLLSGKDGDQVSPTRWRLKVDAVRLVAQRRVTGMCDLQLTADARSYAGLSCSGSIAPDGERFQVSWRVAGS